MSGVIDLQNYDFLDQIKQHVAAELHAWLPLMATVTAVSGYLVQVQAGIDSSGQRGQQYPCLFHNVPVGTTGVLIPMGGQEKLFVPHDLPLPTAPIVPASAVRDGSSVGTYTDSGSGVTLASLQTLVTGLDATKHYRVLATVAMRLGASTGSPLQQTGVRFADQNGANTALGPKGAGHSNGAYEWAHGAGTLDITGWTGVMTNGVAYASTTGVAHNVAGALMTTIIWEI